MMAITFPNPRAEECPKGCGVPVTNAQTPTGQTKVHTGTWRNDCTPKR